METPGNGLIQISLGVGFIAIELLLFWQSYQAMFNRDELWIEEEKRLCSRKLETKRNDDWDSAQKAQAYWWIIGGVSGVLFGAWLLALQP